MLDGILLVDKPGGITSAGVVREVKRAHRLKSIGHLGTLDPMATGLLPLCIGAGTKIAQFLGAERKNWHRQLAFLGKRPVIDGILAESGKLVEGGMHRAWPRVELGIVASRRLIDRFRIGRQLVPEPIEVDALASFHQPVDVGPAEIEMPQQRALQDFVPWPDAGQRRIDDDPFGDAVGILRGERIADHVADVVRHEIGLLDVELVHHHGDVDALRFLVVAAGRLGRETHPAQVGNDDSVVLVKRLGERRPHVAGVGKAVQEHDRRSVAADADMQRGAVHRDALDLEIRRKRHDGGKSRRCAEHHRDHQDGSQQRISQSNRRYATRRRPESAHAQPFTLCTDEYSCRRNGQAESS